VISIKEEDSYYVMYEDDKKIAYASAYPHSVGNLYLQYIWFSEGAIKRYYYFTKFVDYFHELGWQYILGAIDNKNIVALMWALRKGFKIIGIRQATDNTLYVEVLREVT